jgi:phosphoserine aminotransferase
MSASTTPRKANFYAGPSILPVPVLQKLQETIADYHNSGMSIVETSHRSDMYDEVHGCAIKLIRELLNIPENYHVLFLGGGATLQFSMVPFNLMPVKGTCDYVISGAWAKKAMSDAQKLGNVEIAFDGSASGYSTLPETVEVRADAAYAHITSNETINGVQWKSLPTTGNVPLVADMSSDIMSHPFDVANVGLFYAGAQKNLGPAGVTLVVIRDDLVEPRRTDLTAYLSYKTHVEKNSLYNTPPVFSIYGVKLVLEWIKDNGGLVAMEKNAREKSQLIYDAIDSSDGYYSNNVDPSFRSTMNAVFTLGSAELESKFLKEAEARDMVGLKGHRSVGGCRVSVYNAMPLETVKELADFMSRFMRENG